MKINYLTIERIFKLRPDLTFGLVEFRSKQALKAKRKFLSNRLRKKNVIDNENK